ncbi:hypothetical protein O181_039098 [Austropuccinia psidii MF-1]|uniref:Integrase zinc-binding domain-containing protein n=1 Tax=Austropuccinia psidii MF-1 TaxID=1389203 RepID=A0A9Q3DCQ2_9BASI|nr:hypothetical protein [Austropuccinia psidii MF-1]
MTLTDRDLVKTILHSFHDSVVSGHLLEDRTLERLKTCSLWPNWRKDALEYCQTCARFQNKIGATVHIDFVTALTPEGDRRFNSFLVLVDRYRKAPILLPGHYNKTAMDASIMIWNRVISHADLDWNIISDRNPKLTSSLWTNLHNLFFTNYHSQQPITLRLMDWKK